MILMKRDRQKKACSHVGFLSNIYQIYSKSKDRNTKEFKIIIILILTFKVKATVSLSWYSLMHETNNSLDILEG
jgi:hypothetical protein